ncbi:MAG: ferredoxin [Verrucomicrobia bacterium GWF2_51_19]|nr:MAG: ferredoxin [Verrucomicrobia bacterium GWF2_51_19]HCJ12017.1 ferredoxin [Opitutae bacterium]
MADKENKWPENVKGKYYVDNQCIDCDLCREMVPEIFVREDEGGYSFVAKQPITKDEIEACEEALDACPVNSIGKDG